jgi:hypothetical protein
MAKFKSTTRFFTKNEETNGYFEVKRNTIWEVVVNSHHNIVLKNENDARIEMSHRLFAICFKPLEQEQAW